MKAGTLWIVGCAYGLAVLGVSWLWMVWLERRVLRGGLPAQQAFGTLPYLMAVIVALFLAFVGLLAVITARG